MHTSSLISGARFEAARQVVGAPDRTARPHGHSFRVIARADAQYPGHERLQAALDAAVAPLDYADLNRQLAQCDDLALAAHLRAALPCPAALSLQSSRSAA